MKVLYDYQAFTYQNHGGVSRCFSELYSSFKSHPEYGVDARIELQETDNAYIRPLNIGVPFDDAYKKFLIKGEWPLKHKLYSLYNLFRYGDRLFYWNKTALNQKYCIEQLREGDFDIFHATFFGDYFLPYLNGKPYIITIHDMIPEVYPQFYSNVNDSQILGKKRLVEGAAAIIAVSENTKRDVVRLLRVPESKVHVVYHGCSFEATQHPRPIFNFPYILYVGKRYKYKNFALFVRDMKPILEKHPNLKVVCTGSKFDKAELEMMENMRERYIHYFVPTDEDFYSLYHFAECFVYPSEYEGFGIPILEAYRAGCPVMLNRASCFPEIAGDAAIYFEMNKQYSDFTVKMDAFLNMTNHEKQLLLRKQQEQLKKYSWDKAAITLSKVYKEVYETLNNNNLLQ